MEGLQDYSHGNYQIRMNFDGSHHCHQYDGGIINTSWK